MRTIEVTLGGRVWAMPVGFEPSMRLYEKGVDPLTLSSKLARDPTMTLFEVITIITCGVRCAGCQLPDKAIGDEIIEIGPHEFSLPAAKYVVAFSTGAPKVPVVDLKKGEAPSDQTEHA